MPRSSLVLLVACAACTYQPAQDYPTARFDGIGLHNSRTYLAEVVMGERGVPLLVAHPRLGQAAIARAGEPVAVSWIAPAAPDPTAAEVTLVDGNQAATPWPLAGTRCDHDGVCDATAVSPTLPAGLYGICVAVAGARACSPSALSLVEKHADPVLLAQVSDVHAGDGDSAARFGDVVDALDALDPRPDLVVVTGDCADTGLEDQRRAFLAPLERLQLPSLVVTGNHDYDAAGIDGFLLDIDPELDVAKDVGAIRIVGLSTGQDLDDGNHKTTVSESSGPDASQLAWLGATLDAAPDTPTVVLLHHPLYNDLFGTVGPSRDALLDAVDRPSVRAVLAGHTHYTAVFDGDGSADGLDPSTGELDWERWPLHYTCSRASRGAGGYALITVGTEVVRYRWVGL